MVKLQFRYIIAFLACLAITAYSVFATVTSTSPINNSVLKGLSSENFVAIGSSTTGTVYIDGFGYPLACNATACSTIIDLSLVPDNTNHNYFWVVDSVFYPSFGTNYIFSISRDPVQVTGLMANSISETQIKLDWTASAESDFNHYIIYRNGTQLINTTSNTYTNGGLTIGQSWCYQISAVDNSGNEGSKSSTQCALVQDLTPPSTPSITNTVSNIKPINTNIDYSEPVSLKIIYGAVLIQDLGNGQNFVFTTNPASFGTRYYQALACDSYSNCLTTNFSVTYQGSPVILNATTVDVPFWNEPQYVMTKSQALTDGSDYWVLRSNLTYYKYCNIRPAMSDVVGNSGAVMLVDEQIQPATSCDVNVLVLDYYLDNTEDLLQASLDGNCADLDPSGYINKLVYFKIPVKVGAPVDNWTFNVDWYGDVC